MSFEIKFTDVSIFTPFCLHFDKRFSKVSSLKSTKSGDGIAHPIFFKKLLYKFASNQTTPKKKIHFKWPLLCCCRYFQSFPVGFCAVGVTAQFIVGSWLAASKSLNELNLSTREKTHRRRYRSWGRLKKTASWHFTYFGKYINRLTELNVRKLWGFKKIIE